jgi:hypothetical protein
MINVNSIEIIPSVHPHETNILNCATHRIVWINGIKVKL